MPVCINTVACKCRVELCSRYVLVKLSLKWFGSLNMGVFPFFFFADL